MERGTAYETYGSRRLIELFFMRQEDTMEQDDTREHSDYSVIASDFIDCLSSVMVSRMLSFLERNGLLDSNTHGDILNLMLRVKMTRVGEGEWRLRRIAEKDAERRSRQILGPTNRKRIRGASERTRLLLKSKSNTARSPMHICDGWTGASRAPCPLRGKGIHRLGSLSGLLIAV